MLYFRNADTPKIRITLNIERNCKIAMENLLTECKYQKLSACQNQLFMTKLLKIIA